MNAIKDAIFRATMWMPSFQIFLVGCVCAVWSYLQIFTQAFASGFVHAMIAVWLFGLSRAVKVKHDD